jgi:hypothetical protein
MITMSGVIVIVLFSCCIFNSPSISLLLFLRYLIIREALMRVNATLMTYADIGPIRQYTDCSWEWFIFHSTSLFLYGNSYASILKSSFFKPAIYLFRKIIVHRMMVWMILKNIGVINHCPRESLLPPLCYQFM